MSKINLTKIEELFKKFGHSLEEIERFREKFAQIFLQKVGFSLYQELNEEERKGLDQLLANKRTTFKDLADFLEKLNLKEKTKEVTQKTFDEMLGQLLEKMAMLATDKQYATIKQTLFLKPL